MQGDAPAPITPPDVPPSSTDYSAAAAKPSGAPSALSWSGREVLIGGIGLLICGLVVGLLLGWLFAGRVPHYEYRVITVDDSVVTFVNGKPRKDGTDPVLVWDYLESASAEKWELVGAVPNPHGDRQRQILYLKRKKR